jgi:hypothetical protein
MNKSALSAISLGIILLTVLQGILPTSPLKGDALTWASASILLTLSVLTATQQYFNNCIDNAAIYKTAAITFIAILGAINHFTNTVPLSESLAQWLRFSISALIAVLNTYSETFFPTTKKH